MKEFQVNDKNKIKLKGFDADDLTHGPDGKKAAKDELENLRERLIHLQQMLYAQNKHKLLIILQAMDAGGKDGTIRSIFQGVNPQGVKVVSFKVPTPLELAHDYLWRVHEKTPATGEIVIFNRSHYEDVLVVRINELAPEKVWKKRFQHINAFERLLTEEGTTILKFFLFISKEEQKQRFLERIKDHEKQWKFNPKDLAERQKWDAYMQAYQAVLDKTSSKLAPWYVIPANRNWYRDLLVARILVRELESLKMEYPQPVEDIQQYLEPLTNS